MKGQATRGNRVEFGDYGLQAMEPGWITAAQIEAVRVGVMHYLAREGKLWIRIFPHKSVTATPEETRMGTGKGEPEYWAAVVRPGLVMFELGGMGEEVARQAFLRGAHKLPIRVRLVTRRRV